MVEQIPVGAIVGMCLIALVVGIVLGRSGRFMSKMGTLHASAHGGSAAARAAAQGGNADQRVQTIVVVDRDGVPKADGRYDLDALAGVGVDHAVSEVGRTQVARELVEGHCDESCEAGWSCPVCASERTAEGLPVVQRVQS